MKVKVFAVGTNDLETVMNSWLSASENEHIRIHSINNTVISEPNNGTQKNSRTVGQIHSHIIVNSVSIAIVLYDSVKLS
jgi:hypothetical protein